MKLLAFVLAVGALLVALAFDYTSSVTTKDYVDNSTTVVTSKQDIAAGTRFNPLIRQGLLEMREVPNADVVPNAVTDISQLKGREAMASIYQNEQIPMDRISGGVS